MNSPFTRPLVVGDDEDSIDCLVYPHNEWSKPLLKLLEENSDIELDRFWSSGTTKEAPPLLLALHVTTGGPCCTMTVPLQLGDDDESTQRALRSLQEIHEAGINDNRAAVIQLINGAELYLAAVKDKSDTSLIFWGFVCGKNAPAMTVHLLQSSRLPLVFDLDETLLVAFSTSTMEMRLKYVRESRDKVRRDFDRVPGSMRPELQQKETWLCKEEELLNADLQQLRMFAEGNGIRDGNGDMQFAEFEDITPEKGAPYQRPVIRDPSRSVVFTRIHPDKKETSMIMRIRPGWDMLRAYLLGQTEAGARSGVPLKQRFELYVCTAAEREYALEAWRLLDPDGALIPVERRRQRVVCVPSQYKKTLSKVLGIGPCSPDTGSASQRSMLTPMPLAIIVDDRLEVWEESVQDQILHVLPYVPYKDEAASNAGLQVEDSIEGLTEEMRRIQSLLQKVRANVYWDINVQSPEVLAGSGVVTSGVGVTDEPTTLLPPVRSVATLLKTDNLQVPAVQSANQRPASTEPNPTELQQYSATVSLVPEDPRKASSSGAAPNPGPVSQTTGPSLQPQDPRQTRPAPEAPAISLVPLDPRQAVAQGRPQTQDGPLAPSSQPQDPRHGLWQQPGVVLSLPPGPAAVGDPRVAPATVPGVVPMNGVTAPVPQANNNNANCRPETLQENVQPPSSGSDSGPGPPHAHAAAPQFMQTPATGPLSMATGPLTVVTNSGPSPRLVAPAPAAFSLVPQDPRQRSGTAEPSSLLPVDPFSLQAQPAMPQALQQHLIPQPSQQQAIPVVTQQPQAAAPQVVMPQSLVPHATAQKPQQQLMPQHPQHHVMPQIAAPLQPVAHAPSLHIPQDPRVVTSGMAHDPRASLSTQAPTSQQPHVDPRVMQVTIVRQPVDPRQSAVPGPTVTIPTASAPITANQSSIPSTQPSHAPTASQQVPPTVEAHKPVSLIPQDPRQLAGHLQASGGTGGVQEQLSSGLGQIGRAQGMQGMQSMPMQQPVGVPSSAQPSLGLAAAAQDPRRMVTQASQPLGLAGPSLASLQGGTVSNAFTSQPLPMSGIIAALHHPGTTQLPPASQPASTSLAAPVAASSAPTQQPTVGGTLQQVILQTQTALVDAATASTSGHPMDAATLTLKLTNLAQLQQHLAAAISIGGVPLELQQVVAFQLTALNSAIHDLAQKITMLAMASTAAAAQLPGSQGFPSTSTSQAPAVPRNAAGPSSSETASEDGGSKRSTQGGPPLPPAINPISILNEAAQRSKVVVRYQEDKLGDDGDNSSGGAVWEVRVIWDGREVGFGTSRNKRDAKRVAAEQALFVLRIASVDAQGEAAAGGSASATAAAAADGTRPMASSSAINEQNALQTLQICHPNNVHYKDLGCVGIGQAKHFTAQLSAGDYFAEAKGHSKKNAKQLAAMKILQQMGYQVDHEALGAQGQLPSAHSRPPAGHASRPAHGYTSSGEHRHSSGANAGHSTAHSGPRGPSRGPGAHKGHKNKRDGPGGRADGGLPHHPPRGPGHRPRSPLLDEGGKADGGGRKRRRMFDPDAPTAGAMARATSGYLAQLADELDEPEPTRHTAYRGGTPPPGGRTSTPSSPLAGGMAAPHEADDDEEEEGQIK